jgi:genome maintenance exonuclease 1
MAHDYVYESQIRQGVIMVCTPDLYYQEFRITDHELRTWKHRFLKRLDMYHDLKFDEKEQANIKMKEEDFKNE